jgi:hypothetical protein
MHPSRTLAVLERKEQESGARWYNPPVNKSESRDQRKIVRSRTTGRVRVRT